MDSLKTVYPCKSRTQFCKPDQMLENMAHLLGEYLHGPRKFCQRGPNSENVFFFIIDEGREGPNTTKIGPSSTGQLNAIEMAFHWWADDGPTLNAGLVAL